MMRKENTPFGGRIPEFIHPKILEHARKMGGNCEILSWEFFDTRLYVSEATTRLDFFVDTGKSLLTNDYGMLLYGGQGFLITSVRLYGICSDITLGRFRLDIGSKIYIDVPVWTLAIRERYARRIPLMVSNDGRVLRATIEWQQPMQLGSGLSGKLRGAQPIQVILRGQLARPI